MFETDIKNLTDAYLSICERIGKGEKMINALPEQYGETYDKYVKQLKILKLEAYRADACIDILSGIVTLIGEQGGTLVMARNNEPIAIELALLAEQYGGTVTHLDPF